MRTSGRGRRGGLLLLQGCGRWAGATTRPRSAATTRGRCATPRTRLTATACEGRLLQCAQHGRQRGCFQRRHGTLRRGRTRGARVGGGRPACRTWRKLSSSLVYKSPRHTSWQSMHHRCAYWLYVRALGVRINKHTHTRRGFAKGKATAVDCGGCPQGPIRIVLRAVAQACC